MSEIATLETHVKSKTREDRAREKLKQAKAELRRISQENHQEKRRNENRAKIILGGLVLKNLPASLPQLLALASERDREFLRSVGIGV